MDKLKEETMNQSKCEHCKGSGYVLIAGEMVVCGETCAKCGGTGVVND